MNQSLVTAVFDDRSDAQRAIEQLRSAGISDSSISVIGRDGEGGKATSTDGAGEETGDLVSKTAPASVRSSRQAPSRKPRSAARH
jgi:hypothetical protein